MVALSGATRVEASGSLRASGHGPDLWIVRDQGDDHVLLHRRRDDAADMLRQAATLSSPLHKDGLAAGLSRVWIIQSNQSVWVVRYERQEASDVVRYARPAILPRLPQGLMLRRSAGAKRKLWALASASPKALGAQGRGVVEGEDDLPTAEDRLLFLDGTRWHDFSLPARWPHGSAARLLVTAGGGPRLIARDPTGAVVLYRHAENQWHRTVAAWPAGGGGEDISAALVDSQLVLAAAGTNAMPPVVDLYFARDKIVRFGAVELGSSGAQWRMTATDDHATVVVGQGDVLRWSQVDLQGRLAKPLTTLKTGRPLRLDRATDFVLWMGTLITATLIMFLFWKRDPQSNRAELPTTMALADLTRRVAAGAVDLIPCMVVAMVLFGVNADQIIARWPGHAGSVSRMAPSGTVIFLFIGHTMLTEIFTGRSLGKAMLGLRTTNLVGGRATWKQLVLRNVMKVLDLVAPPLLILPLAGPQKQRLGDMVARTVVVVGSDVATGQAEDDNAKVVGDTKDREDTDGT